MDGRFSKELGVSFIRLALIVLAPRGFRGIVR